MMNKKGNSGFEKIIYFGFAIFVIIMIAFAGAFYSIIGGFIESFGLGFGLILGVLFCLIIIFAILEGGGR